MTNQNQFSKSKVWIFLGLSILGCVVLTGIAGFVFITFFGGQIIGNSIAKGSYGLTVDNFMTAMAQENTEQAYQFLSSSGQKNISIDVLNEMVQQGLFSGYQSIEVRSLNQPENYCYIPQPANTINIGGRILYNTNKTNDYFFVLEQEGSNWKIYCMNIGKLGIP